MNVYVGTVNGEVKENGYRSLKGMCEELGVSYNSAIRGKRIWLKGDEARDAIEIFSVNVVKMKKRGTLKKK